MTPSTDSNPDDKSHAALGALDRFDRASAIEHLVCHLAHQLGSPLNVIEGRASMMASGQVREADVPRQARIIAEQASRMVQILRDVVSACRRAGRGVSHVDLRDLADLAVELFAPLAAARRASISLERDGAPVPSVRGNADTLLVALAHVLDNGLRATPDGGTLRVRVRAEERAQDPEQGTARAMYACFDVDDDGPGIEADAAPRLFKPFANEPSPQEPCGEVGLFIAQAIAKDHGGWIEGVNKEGRGALFTLHLPSEQSHAQ
jgi:signal transduction histidine kinase